MNKLKKRGLAFHLILGFILIILVLSAFISYVGYRQFILGIEERYDSVAFQVAEAVEECLDPKEFKAFFKTGKFSKEHQDIQAFLDRLVVVFRCDFIYVEHVSPSDYRTTTRFYDAVHPSTGIEPLSPGFVSEEVDPQEVPDIKRVLAGEDTVRVVRSGFRDVLRARSAVWDSNGEVVAMVVVERPMVVLYAARRRYLITVALLVSFAILFVAAYYTVSLHHILIEPITEITEEAKRFADDNRARAGELKAASNKYEIGVLARSLHKMELDINQYIADITWITADKERVAAELNVAAHIQADMLPRKFPDRPEFALCASMTPAREVGGDFYDFFLIDSDHLALVMADVSDKGVPAGLFMVKARTLIRNRALYGKDMAPGRIMASVNGQLCDGNEANFFVTAWLGILEIPTGKIWTVNAGHEYPALRRAGAAYELVKDEPGLPLGVMEDAEFPEHELELRPGDSLYLFTDGVTEATNAQKELFGAGRMLEALNLAAGAPAAEVLEEVRRVMDAFVAGAPQFDDITMLCLNYFGKERPE